MTGGNMQSGGADGYISLIAIQYRVRSTDDSKYTVTCGRVIAQFENYEEAANRAYQLNRAALLN
jgi:hypothetical protein